MEAEGSEVQDHPRLHAKLWSRKYLKLRYTHAHVRAHAHTHSHTCTHTQAQTYMHAHCQTLADPLAERKRLSVFARWDFLISFQDLLAWTLPVCLVGVSYHRPLSLERPPSFLSNDPCFHVHQKKEPPCHHHEENANITGHLGATQVTRFPGACPCTPAQGLSTHTDHRTETCNKN